ncbi:SdpI/YhfL protein family protein [Caloranaerobacter azorensis DSM 13643]|uniref:SdpI/YhfL protein family protein n=2 Tax=Caloranaerobacter azorensis TaxID=116090 RepID=A0A1M5UBT5_9FIRM|nr:SdpI/YhfL protein family protein [Caloranaerobacter azorensis DSM 13643]
MVKTTLFFNIITGVSMVIVGIILKIFPPKKINFISGYRTYLSMKNKETWEEGNRYSAKMLIVLGVISIIISFVIYKTVNPKISAIISTIVSLVLIILAIPLTELHLKKLFDKDGNRKV